VLKVQVQYKQYIVYLWFYTEWSMTCMNTSNDVCFDMIIPCFLIQKQSHDAFSIETAQSILWLLNTFSIEFTFQAIWLVILMANIK